MTKERIDQMILANNQKLTKFEEDPEKLISKDFKATPNERIKRVKKRIENEMVERLKEQF